jgi:hypothetical protein
MSRQEDAELVKEAKIVNKVGIECGGGFFRHIAAAIGYADLNNLRKLKATFPQEWQNMLALESMVEDE